MLPTKTLLEANEKLDELTSKGKIAEALQYLKKIEEMVEHHSKYTHTRSRDPTGQEYKFIKH